MMTQCIIKDYDAFKKAITELENKPDKGDGHTVICYYTTYYDPANTSCKTCKYLSYYDCLPGTEEKIYGCNNETIRNLVGLCFRDTIGLVNGGYGRCKLWKKKEA